MNTKYIKTIFYAFYSPEPYKDALRNWHGFGLRYLFIVTAISSSFIAAGWMWDLSKLNPAYVAESISGFIISNPELSFEDNINRFVNIVSQIPDIKIENDKMTTSASEPYAITDPVSGYDIAIIDTSGKSKSLEGTDAVLLITDSRFIVKDEKGRENIIYLKDLEQRYNLDEGAINEALHIISQIPPFGLHYGRFITENNQLYKILDNKNRELAQVGADAVLSDGAEPFVVISSSEINYKTLFSKKINSIKAEDLTEKTFTELLQSGASSMKTIMLWGVPIIVLPAVVLTSFMFNCLMLVSYACIGQLLMKMMKLESFEYKQMMRIAVVAITPMLLLSMMLPKLIPSQGVVYFLISIGYIYYAIKSVTSEK